MADRSDPPDRSDALARAAQELAGELELVVLPATASAVRRRAERRRARRRGALTAGCAALAVALAGGSWHLLGSDGPGPQEAPLPPAAEQRRPPPSPEPEPKPEAELPMTLPPAALPGPVTRRWQVTEHSGRLREYAGTHKIDCDLPWAERSWNETPVPEPVARREAGYVADGTALAARFQILEFASEAEAQRYERLEWRGTAACGMDEEPTLRELAAQVTPGTGVTLAAGHWSVTEVALREQYVARRGPLVAVLLVVGDATAQERATGYRADDGHARAPLRPADYRHTMDCLVARLDPAGPRPCEGDQAETA
jgi:hypothetical protein